MATSVPLGKSRDRSCMPNAEISDLMLDHTPSRTPHLQSDHAVTACSHGLFDDLDPFIFLLPLAHGSGANAHSKSALSH